MRSKEAHGIAEQPRGIILEGCRDHDQCFSEPLPFARRQTTSGVSGRSLILTPKGASASSTALAMAAGEGIAAPSPAAFWPSDVNGDGDGRWMTSTFGVSAVEHLP